ncbi:XRE family transcriptional regulator [Micromonospora chalcea]
MRNRTDRLKKVTHLPKSPDTAIEQAADAVELFDGSRLTQARQLAALTKRALAEIVGVSPAAIGQYESGAIRPRPDLAMRLAEALSVPVRFFAFSPGRPRASIDASMAHFKCLRSTRAYERERAAAFASRISEVGQALERHVRLPTVDLPGWAGGEVVPEMPLSPAAAARELRRRWSLGTGPIPHMVRLLESKGIVVCVLPFSEAERVRAFSSSRLPRPVVVLTNDKSDVYRQRFSAAHELGHLVMHGEARPGDIEHERAADNFAAEFLMPSASISSDLPARVDFKTYVRLQESWGVSVDALLYRSRELGLLGDAPYRRAWQRLADFRSNGILTPEPIEGYPGEQPVLLMRALDIARQRGLTIEKLAAGLDLYEETVRLYLGAEEEQLPEVSFVDFVARRRIEPAAGPTKQTSAAGGE